MNTNTVLEKQKIYCAIYTRKSTSEGLEQEFTTLDAQRESGINYIKSQKNEGWIALDDLYDDGGYTGSNTERPALQKLIENIKTGKINCVVVYKVDRLSRSLVDFTHLLELFEKHNVTFVSVTQAFNTNTSMGRLTLNILLSFAQFEREIISERTKDKMAAARKRGKWLGGRPPLGYDWIKETKKLAINPTEAEAIKTIYDLYLKGYSLKHVAQALTEKGLRSKSYTTNDGKKTNGNAFQNTTISHILHNSLYIGKVSYNGEIYEGEQEAIIDEDAYNRVQELLKKNRNYKELVRGNKVINILTKLLFCKACNRPMIATYTYKAQKTKYRYYVCIHAQKYGYYTCKTKTINAFEIEKAVTECLFNHPEGAKLKDNWQNFTSQEQKSFLVNLVKQIDYDTAAKKLLIAFSDGTTQEYSTDLKEVRHITTHNPKVEIKNEPKLRQRLILAYQAQELLDSGKATSIKQVAQWLNMSAIQLHLIIELLFLSPKIQEEILIGPNEILNAVPEYKANLIAREFNWTKQIESWQTLTQETNL